MGISNKVKNFIFIILCFCFALAWQTSDIQIFSFPTNTNFLLFICFYFYYIKSSFPKSTLLIMVSGFCYDALNSNPLFITSTTMLIVCFILHFYIKRIDFVGGFGFNGMVFFISVIVNRLLINILMFLFSSDSLATRNGLFFTEIFCTLLLYVILTPVLNFIHSLILKDENHLQMKINTIK